MVTWERMSTQASPLRDVSESGAANGCDNMNPAENQMSLQRACKTLRGIRERYQTERSAHPGARFYSMHVVVDAGDMAWITATIESVEKVLAGDRGGATGGYSSQTKAATSPLIDELQCVRLAEASSGLKALVP